MTTYADMVERALDLAERQHGVIGREQLTGIGLSRQRIHHLREGQQWARVGERVLRARGSAPTTGQRLMCALLDAGPGAFLSGTTAAAFWGIPGFSLSEHWRLQVTRPRRRSRRSSTLAQIHEVIDVQPGHVMTLHGLPISVPARTVFEVAAAVRPEKAERACDSALSMRLTSVRLLQRMLDDWADRGRAGTAAMRQILERRSPVYVPPASNLEHRFAALVDERGLGPFLRQVDLGDGDWVGRVDFKHVSLPVVVEVLSDRYHSSLLDRTADEERFRRLEAAGFAVIQVWDVEVWHDPGPMLVRVAEHVRAARRAAA